MLTRDTRVLVQGATGHHGRFHLAAMKGYGTTVVGGVAPGKGGENVDGVPVFETVAEAVAATGADASVVFVPAPYALDAAFEAMAHGIRLLAVIAEHVPVFDAMDIVHRARELGVTVVGPNTFGVISPAEQAKMGIMPSHIYMPGPVGVVARSGTLSYEIAYSLTSAGLGQSTVVGLGGDPVVGQTFETVLDRFRDDPLTRAVVLIGEIGGGSEEAAEDAVRRLGKPVVAYLAGRAAPAGKRMGHAGAIIERGRGTIDSKERALRRAGAEVVDMPWQVAEAVASALGPDPI